MTTTELNLATTCIKTLATAPNADEQIKLVLHELFSSIMQKNSEATNANVTPIQNKIPRKDSNIQTREKNYLQFTKKEIRSMPSNYKKYFI